MGALLMASVLPATAVASGADSALFFATSTSGDPSDAIVGGGFWGHEGPGRDLATVISTDLTGGAGDDWDPDRTALVFTLTSPDGSAEEPVVTAGQTIAEAYPFFTTAGLLDPVQGVVSTKGEWDDWVAAGQPNQEASSDDLELRDVDEPEGLVSEHPRGRSILNRWAAGQALSAVIVRTTGEYVDGIPVIDASSGRAQAAWLTFTSAVDSAIGDTAHEGVASSGAYLLTTGVAPAEATEILTVPSLPAGPFAAGDAIPSTAAVTPAGGVLALATPYTTKRPLDVGTFTLAPDAMSYVASVPFVVRVTDTRAGAPRWTVSGLVSELTDEEGRTIGAQTPSLAMGPVTELTGNPGTAELSGVLTLTAPVSTSPGHYTGWVTFTIA